MWAVALDVPGANIQLWLCSVIGTLSVDARALLLTFCPQIVHTLWEP